MTDAVEYREIAHHAQHRLLLRADDVRGADQFRGAAEFGARAGCGDLRHGLAAPHQRAGDRSARPGPASIGTDSPVSMDWSSSTSPPISRTSAATTPPSDSLTTSPGTSSAAGMVFQAPSRRTDAFSARRDFSAARVAWARLSWNKPKRRIEHQQSAR